VEEDLRHINVEGFFSTQAYHAPRENDIAELPSLGNAARSSEAIDMLASRVLLPRAATN
jgi:hypothetical protein